MVLNMCQVLNISDFWIFVNICKYDGGSKYVLGYNYGGVWNIPGFGQVSAHARVAQGSEYGWIMPCGSILNIPGYRFIGL